MDRHGGSCRGEGTFQRHEGKSPQGQAQLWSRSLIQKQSWVQPVRDIAFSVSNPAGHSKHAETVAKDFPPFGLDGGGMRLENKKSKGKNKWFVSSFIDYQLKHWLGFLCWARHCAQHFTSNCFLNSHSTVKQGSFNLLLAVEEAEPLERLRNLFKVTQEEASWDSVPLGGQACALNHCATLPPCVRTSCLPSLVEAE